MAKTNEMQKIVKENISKLKKKDFNMYFFILDTKGNPNTSLEYIYKTALFLKSRGYNVSMLHQEKEFIGVGEWLGEKYMEIPHYNIEKDNVEISPCDFLFIPEIFANVMLQTKKLPCKRIVIVQNYSNITEFMPISQTLESLGIFDAIATSEFHKTKIESYFPGIRTYIVPPSVDNVFRNNDEPRKLIINLMVKEQSDANRIVKPFYWKNPIYRWVSFRDLRNVSNEVLAEALRESAITIWVDDNTDFGTSLLSAVRCGGVVLAKTPNQPKDWMVEKGKLTESILWFNDIDELPNLIASIVRTWTVDGIPAEIYENQTKLDKLYTEDVQQKSIIDVYENNIISKRLNDFEEVLANLKNNEIKEE